MGRKRAKKKDGKGATLGFEQTLWQVADKLRNLKRDIGDWLIESGGTGSPVRVNTSFA